jgi:hypothetical protein
MQLDCGTEVRAEEVLEGTEPGADIGNSVKPHVELLGLFGVKLELSEPVNSLKVPGVAPPLEEEATLDGQPGDTWC